MKLKDHKHDNDSLQGCKISSFNEPHETSGISSISYGRSRPEKEHDEEPGCTGVRNSRRKSFWDSTPVKTILIFLTLFALMSSAMANPFADVPRAHWSYQAVSNLAERGILTGYPDNTFRGNKSITRYEMALVIARLVNRSDEMKLSGRGMNSDDFDTLQRLTLEFADELALVGVKVNTLEDEVAVVRDEMAVVKEEVRLAKRGEPGKIRVTGELYGAYVEQHYDGDMGSYVQSPNDAATENLAQQLRLFVDSPVDEDVALHFALEYGWNNWGSGAGGVERHFDTGFNITDAYLNVTDFFGWADTIRIGRQQLVHANDLLFNPMRIDGVFGAKNVHHMVEVSSFGAVRNSVAEDMGLNLFGITGDIDLNDVRVKGYFVQKVDHNDLHNPSSSGVTSSALAGEEYRENGQYEANTYGAGYLSNWSNVTATRYYGLALNGHVFRDLTYYAETAAMSWNQDVVDPAYSDGSNQVGTQFGFNWGLKWDANDDFTWRLRYRYHSEYFEPATATKGVFSNNLTTYTGFGEDWPTSWELLGYTRDFSDIFTRLEYQLNHSSMVWGAFEWITDNREAAINEFQDNMSVLSGGLKYFYKKNTFMGLSWYYFDAQDATSNAFPNNNVGATNKTSGTTPPKAQNLHIGRVNNIEEDQSLLRLEVHVRF